MRIDKKLKASKEKFAAFNFRSDKCMKSYVEAGSREVRVNIT